MEIHGSCYTTDLSLEMNMPRERTRHVMTDVENGRELLDFPLSMKLGKIIFQRDSQQGKEKNDNAIRKCLRLFVQICVFAC